MIQIDYTICMCNMADTSYKYHYLLATKNVNVNYDFKATFVHISWAKLGQTYRRDTTDSTADAWLKKKFQVAGRTTFCHLFLCK